MSFPKYDLFVLLKRLRLYLKDNFSLDLPLGETWLDTITKGKENNL